MYFFLRLVNILCSVSPFVLETPLGRPEQPMLVTYSSVIKIPFSWPLFWGYLGTCSFPVPLNCRLPRLPASSLPGSSLVYYGKMKVLSPQ